MNKKTTTLFAAMAVISVFAACAKDYTDPANVTKTGATTASGSSIVLDFSQPSGYTVATAATKASAISGAASVIWEVDSTTSPTGIRPKAAASSSSTQASQSTIGYMSNTNFTGTATGTGAYKTMTATLKWTWGSTASATQKIGLLQAFSADLNNDGTTTDAVAYGVQLSYTAAAGGVLFIRNSSGVTNAGTCVLASAQANLANAGAHTATITFTPANNGTTVVISVSVDGGAASTFTEAPATNMSTCAGAGADAATIGLFSLPSGNATVGGVLNSSTVPINAFQLQGYSGDATFPVDANASPIINSLTIQ